MSLLKERIAVTHPLVPLTFVGYDLAASQTGTGIYIVATGPSAKIDAQTHVLPWNGCLMAVAIKLSTAKTAGTLSITPTIDGTAVSALTTTVGTATDYTTRVNYNAARFSAGAKLGVAYTSDASFAPSTMDIAVVVYVVYDGVMY